MFVSNVGVHEQPKVAREMRRARGLEAPRAASECLRLTIRCMRATVLSVRASAMLHRRCSSRTWVCMQPKVARGMRRARGLETPRAAPNVCFLRSVHERNGALGPCERDAASPLFVSNMGVHEQPKVARNAAPPPNRSLLRPAMTRQIFGKNIGEIIDARNRARYAYVWPGRANVMFSRKCSRFVASRSRTARTPTGVVESEVVPVVSQRERERGHRTSAAHS